MTKKTKSDLGHLHAILVPKKLAKNHTDAIDKARKYGKVNTVEEQKNFFRCRRSGGDDFPDYHTRTLPNGVQLVYGRDVNGSEED